MDVKRKQLEAWEEEQAACKWEEAHPGEDFHETQEEFKHRLERAFLELSPAVIRKAMEALPGRLREIDANGGELLN